MTQRVYYFKLNWRSSDIDAWSPNNEYWVQK